MHGKWWSKDELHTRYRVNAGMSHIKRRPYQIRWFFVLKSLILRHNYCTCNGFLNRAIYWQTSLFAMAFHSGLDNSSRPINDTFSLPWLLVYFPFHGWMLREFFFHWKCQWTNSYLSVWTNKHPVLIPSIRNAYSRSDKFAQNANTYLVFIWISIAHTLYTNKVDKLSNNISDNNMKQSCQSTVYQDCVCVCVYVSMDGKKGSSNQKGVQWISIHETVFKCCN